MKMAGKSWVWWVAMCLWLCNGCTQKSASATSQLKINNNTMENKQYIVVGGGCFWCMEAVFQRIKGVEKVESGYAGGVVKNPTYKEVCTGETQHAEVIKITYDKDQISLRTLLELFFAFHDPTTLNRQGADVGTQYRSVIFYATDAERAVAQSVIEELNKSIFDGKIVTELMPEAPFYKAEAYHQNYYNQNTEQPYCQVAINPKVAKLKKNYSELLKD